MKYLFYLLAISITFCSCSTSNYYLCYVDKPVSVFQNPDINTQAFVVPAGKLIIAKSTKKKFRAVKFGDRNGYIRDQNFPTETKYSTKELQYLRFNKDSIYSYQVNPSENSSNSSSISNQSSTSGGPVQVKGYYRKNGTYVQPHTRSAPTKRH